MDYVDIILKFAKVRMCVRMCVHHLHTVCTTLLLCLDHSIYVVVLCIYVYLGVQLVLCGRLVCSRITFTLHPFSQVPELTRNVALYLSEFSLLHMSFLTLKPSYMAAAIVLLATIITEENSKYSQISCTYMNSGPQVTCSVSVCTIDRVYIQYI